MKRNHREKRVQSVVAQLIRPRETSFERVWLTESQRRLDEIEQGKAKIVPGRQVLDEARRLIKSMSG